MTYPRADIPNLYQQGHSLNKVSELTGVSYSTVRQDLIAAGIPIRSKKEAVNQYLGGWKRKRGMNGRFVSSQLGKDQAE